MVLVVFVVVELEFSSVSVSVELSVVLVVVVEFVVLVLFPSAGVFELSVSTGMNEYLGIQKSYVATFALGNNVFAKLFPEQSVNVISIGGVVFSALVVPDTILISTTATTKAKLVKLLVVK